MKFFLTVFTVAVVCEGSIDLEEDNSYSVTILEDVENLDGLGRTFNDYVAKYFLNLFGEGGLLYLSQFPSFAENFKGKSKGSLKYLINELKAILNIDQGIFKKNRDGEVRYRIHRLLGILRSRPDLITEESIQYTTAYPNKPLRSVMDAVITNHLKLRKDQLGKESVAKGLMIVEELPVSATSSGQQNRSIVDSVIAKLDAL